MWQYSDQWAAGFFDGEGCVQIEPRPSKYRTSYYVNITVVQNDRRPLEILKERFGGIITSSRKSSDKTSRWRASGRKAETFLRAVFPHLLVKREQARLALALRERIGPVGVHVADQTEHLAREAIYHEFRETFRR